MTQRWRHIPDASWRHIAEATWVTVGRGKRLHAVGVLTRDPSVRGEWFGEGATACSVEGVMVIPGLLTRLGAPRCKRCCARTGMPQGNQSPVNDSACRAAIDARLRALGTDAGGDAPCPS